MARRNWTFTLSAACLFFIFGALLTLSLSPVAYIWEFWWWYPGAVWIWVPLIASIGTTAFILRNKQTQGRVWQLAGDGILAVSIVSTWWWYYPFFHWVGIIAVGAGVSLVAPPIFWRAVAVMPLGRFCLVLFAGLLGAIEPTILFDNLWGVLPMRSIAPIEGVVVLGVALAGQWVSQLEALSGQVAPRQAVRRALMVKAMFLALLALFGLLITWWILVMSIGYG